MYLPSEADSLYKQTEQQWEQTLLVCTPPSTTVTMRRQSFDFYHTLDFTDAS